MAAIMIPFPVVRRTGWRVLCALSIGLFAGCSDKETFYPVSGKILLEGKPLTGVGQGSVSFRGDTVKGNATMHQPTGAIGPSGEYELLTVGRKGAPPGWYKVVVSAYANKLEEGPVPPRLLLEKKYYSEEMTDLSIEVVAQPAPGLYDLKVSK